MRIAVGGFLHESHSFAPVPTAYFNFVTPGGAPPLVEGPAMLAALAGTTSSLAGAMAAAEDATLVPLAWAAATPAGPVQDEAFERISALICANLSRALDEAPIDGIFLNLHGAAVADSFPDMEGELLRRIRAIAGAVPLTISLDPHCNWTQQMVDRVDVAVPYCTYPHVDQHEAGARAMKLLLARIRRGKPWARAFRQLDFWTPLTSQCTLVDPMKSVFDERTRIAETHGVVELGFCFGFPYADFDGCGMAIAAYADTQDAADAAADELAIFINAREASFALDVRPVSEIVAQAIVIAATADRPVIIADTQDNPGGGGHGDTTGLLAELIAQDAQGAVMVLINDHESAAACTAAGIGATLELSLGGRSDGVPLAVTAKVEALSDGLFVGTGPMRKGTPTNLGACALISVSSGVRALVTTRQMQALDQSLLTHIGVDPLSCKIIALKSSVHFRADFQPISSAVLVAAAPGPVVADPSVLPFRHLRAGLRLRPMDNRHTTASGGLA